LSDRTVHPARLGDLSRDAGGSDCGAMLWLKRTEPVSSIGWFLRGVSVSLFPWLHTKFLVFFAAFGLLLLLRARSERSLRSMLLFVIPMGISAAVWLLFFWVIYGTFDPQAPYADYVAQFVRLENVPRSLLGALFDQKFGLLVYAPIYAVAPFGA